MVILLNCTNCTTIDLTAIIIGVATSLVASFVFSYLFTRLKPKIKISEVIAVKNNDGKISFKLKVINKCKSPAINIKAELSYINYFQVPGGMETNSHKIDLNKAEIFSLDEFDPDAQYAPYSYMFITTEDLRHGLTQNNRQYIRFKISATHSLSNIGKVFEKKYFRNSFQDGEFIFGNNLNVGQ